jgi:PAS domain S-box-containing protein
MSIFLTDENGKKQFNTLTHSSFMKYSPNAIIIVNLDNKIIAVSHRTLRFFHLESESKLIGTDVLSIIHSSEKEHAEKFIKRVLEEKIIDNEIITFIFPPSKEVFYAEINASCIIDEESNVAEAIFFTARDITDRKKAEKQLLFTHFVMDNAISIIIWFDENGIIKYANDTALHILGYTREELLKLRVFDLDNSFDPKEWKKMIFDLKLNHTHTFESRLITKENHSFQTESTFKHLEYNGDELFCAFVRNISERKKAERDLLESEKHYKSIIEQSLAGFFIVDIPTKKIISANKAFCEMLGYSKNEITQLAVYDLIIDPTEYTKFQIYEVQHRTKSSTGEREFRKKDGSLIILFINSNPISYKGDIVMSNVAIDITKIKLMEKALTASEEKFRLVADYTYDWEYWMDENGKLIYISPSCERTTGYTRQDFLLDNTLFAKIIHTDFKNAVEKHSKEEFEKEKAYNFNYKIITKFGEIRWINHICQPVFNEEGQFLGRRASNRDFTERKIAQDLLVESESRYRAVVEDQTELICRHDENCILSFVNEAYCRYFNRKYDDLIGSCGLDTITSRAKEDAISFFIKAKNLLQPFQYETQVFLQNGQTRWVEWNTHSILDDQGNFVEFQSVGRDITDKKYTEEALETEKEHLRVTLRSIGDAVVTTDTEGRIVIVNRAAEEMLNIKQKNVKFKYFSEIFYARFYDGIDIFSADFIFDVIASEETIQIDEPIIIKSLEGKESIIALSAAPIRDTDFNIYGVVIVLKDITERMKNIETIINSQKLESIGTLAAGIAHEFNNILTAILGNISLARTFLKEGDEKIIKRLTEAENASLRAKDVAQQLVVFAKGGVPIKTELDIISLITDTSLYIFNETKVKYVLNFDPELPLIMGDKNQLRQAISNIFLNAREAMHDEGALNVSVALNADESAAISKKNAAKDFIKIEIQDNGSGIRTDLLSKVLDPYFSTKSKSRGLGLTTSYYIITRHSGNLSISSTEGEGTTITILLPVK